MTSDRRPWILAGLAAAAATLAFFLAMWLGTDGRWSLPLDDAFIFFQYAREFATGHPFRYNGTDAASGGVTSVATLLIDTLGYLVGFRGDGMVLFALLCGGAGLALSLVGAWRLGRALGMERPAWAAAFVGLNGPLLWGLYAGMDLPLYVAAILWTLASWAEERGAGPGRRRTIRWGCLAALSRPEGLTFSLVLSTLLLAEALADRRRVTAAAPTRWLTRLLPVAAGLLPMAILWVATGRPTPTSLDVKGAVGTPGVDLGTWLGAALEYFNAIVRQIFFGFEGEKPARLQGNNASGIPFYLAPLSLILFLAGLLPGAAREGSERRPGPYLLGGMALLAALVSASLVVPRTWHWHRYLIPTYALLLPFAALGLDRLAREWSRRAPEAPPGSLPRALFLTWLLLALPGTAYFLLAFAQNSADIAFQQRALGDWVRTNLPAGSRLGVNDAGALRYDGGFPIVDFEGLTTPALTAHRRQGSSSLWEALERMPAAARPTHLVVYPNWYDAAFVRPHRLLHQRRLFRQTIAGGNPMNVYEADWSLAGSGDGVSSAELQGLLAGKRPVDRLDVADLVSEREHGYVYRSLEGQYQGILELQPTGAGGDLIDGGRMISRSEEFTVRGLSPGRDLTLVLRSRGGFRVRVGVDGQEEVEWLEPGRGGPNWTESSLTLPGSLVRRESIRLRIGVAEEHATVYTAFHYWFYQ